MLPTIVGNTNEHQVQCASQKGTLGKLSNKQKIMLTKDEIRFLHACEHGEMDVIDSLLGQVNINCVNDDGQTGLILALHSEDSWVIDVVNKLLHHGIDVDIEDWWGDALNYVLENEPFNPQLASLIMMCSKKSLDDTKTSRLHACTVESYAFVVENGLDINRIRTHETENDGLEGTYLDHIGNFINYMREKFFDREDIRIYKNIYRVLRSLGAKHIREL